jgi:hypothetical protein
MMSSANRKPKQLIYRFNGNRETEEVKVDATGQIAVPRKNSIFQRNGKTYKVSTIIQQESVSDPRMLPVWRIFLVDATD